MVALSIYFYGEYVEVEVRKDFFLLSIGMDVIASYMDHWGVPDG